jgi:hypothetical protein
MDGLKRYNEIQKALSSFRKESGTKFIASFQKTASQIYHRTKNDPLKQVINNIDKNYDNVVPELPSEALAEGIFFDYEDAANVFPANLHVKSTQLHGKDWNSDTSNYKIVFKDFCDYCNENNGNFWSNSDDAPRFQFGKIDFDDAEGIYYSELTIDRADTYGYEPGMGRTENKDVEPSEIKPKIKEFEPLEEIEEPEAKPSKKAPKEVKEITKIKAEIEKVKAETEREKATEKKVKEINKAVKNLKADLKEGLITKKQYSKYLGKLYGM